MNNIDRDKLVRAGYTLLIMDKFRNRLKYRNLDTDGRFKIWDKEFKTFGELKAFYLELLTNNEKMVGIEF